MRAHGDKLGDTNVYYRYNFFYVINYYSFPGRRFWPDLKVANWRYVGVHPKKWADTKDNAWSLYLMCVYYSNGG